jgi:cellulose biosynthesis protein BcsQ
MRCLASFNSQSSAEKTSLLYHIAWMLAQRGRRTLLVDLDPQCHLSLLALGSARLEQLWDARDASADTIYEAIRPRLERDDEVALAHREPLSEELALLVGDPALSSAEEEFSAQWSPCLANDPHARRVTSALSHAISAAAEAHRAEITLLDIGPNLSALNRAALLAASHLITPVSPDLLSLRALSHLGAWLKKWRQSLAQAPAPRDPMLSNRATPAGYIVMQHTQRLNLPDQPPQWDQRLAQTYQMSVLERSSSAPVDSPDPSLIYKIKPYRSLTSLAQELRKPMFSLKPADGALGAHQASVQQCRRDFEQLVDELCARIGLDES